MDTSKVNQTELSYSCTSANASVNLYTGRLLVENLDFSIGVGEYNVGISNIYNSNFSLPSSLQTYMGNKWKLNLQQYLYTTDEGKTYIYIDELGMKHNFEKLDDNKYYDTSGLGLTLKLGEEENTISDLAGNKLEFKNEILYRIIPNKGPYKKIESDNGKILEVELYDSIIGKQVVFNLNYNDNNLLESVVINKNQLTSKQINYIYDDNQNLIGIIKKSNSNEREYLKMEYKSEQMMRVISLLDKTAIEFSYDSNNKVICVEKKILTNSEIYGNAEGIYCNDDIYLGELYYLGEEERSKLIEKNYIYYYRGDEYYTEISNDSDINYIYFLNKNGETKSLFEEVKGNPKNLLTLNQPVGIKTSLKSNTTEKINNEGVYEGVSSNSVELNVESENTTITDENFVCSFLFKTNVETVSNRIKVTANNKLVSYGTYDNKAPGSWQELTFQFENENETINNIKIEIINPQVGEKIFLSNVRLMPSAVSKVYLKKGEEELPFENIYYLKTDTMEEKISLIGDNQFLFTDLQKILEQKFKNFNDENFVLQFNNGTKKMLVKSITLYDFNEEFEYSIKICYNDSIDNSMFFVKNCSKDNKQVAKTHVYYTYKDFYNDSASYKCLCQHTIGSNEYEKKEYVNESDELLLSDISGIILREFEYDSYGRIIKEVYSKKISDTKTEEEITTYLYSTTGVTINKGNDSKTINYNTLNGTIKSIQGLLDSRNYEYNLWGDKVKSIVFPDNIKNTLNYYTDGTLKSLIPDISVSDSLVEKENYTLTKYGHKFKYDEIGNICRYYLITGDNYNVEKLIYEEYFDEKNNKLNRKNYRGVYYDYLTTEFDSYGRVKKYVSSNSEFTVDRDNDYCSGRIIKIEQDKNTEKHKVYNFSYDDLGYINYKITDPKNSEPEFLVNNKEKYEEIQFGDSKYNIVTNELSDDDNTVLEILFKKNDEEFYNDKYIHDFHQDDCGRISYTQIDQVISSYNYDESNNVLVDKRITFDDYTYKDRISYQKIENDYQYDTIINSLSIEKTFEEGKTYRNEYVFDSKNQLVKEYNCLASNQKGYVYANDGSLVEIRKYDIYDEELYSIEKNFKYEEGRLKEIVDSDNNKVILSYDDYGNVTAINNSTLIWNSDGQLGSYNNINFEYDSFRRRSKKTVKKNNEDILEIKYYYDIQGRLIIEDHGEYKLKYNYGFTGVEGFFLINSSEVTHYIFIKNNFGDIIGILEKDNNKYNIVVEYFYDAWGNTIKIVDTSLKKISEINPFRYRGYYYDVETNLFLVSSRYYSPELCRWISPDDIEYLDPESVNGLNLYCYCFNDPINYIDPDGHAPKWLQGLAIGLAVVGAVLVVGAVTVLTCGVGTLAGTMAGAVIYGAAQGIAIGAAVGVVGGGIVGGIASDWSAEGVLIGMGIGLGAGAIVGGVIGGFAGASGFTANSAYISQYGGNVKEVLSAYKGNPRLKVLNSNTTAYRTWGGTSGKFGHWISPKNYGSAARNMLSLPPGNTAANTSQFLISKGSTVLSGKAAALFGQTGGGIQWWIGLL
ncbi:MAG: hypothetical protein IJX78_06525 [Bacilli bacterium]|nr:hypothetical protein [Bacilli bacterium]